MVLWSLFAIMTLAASVAVLWPLIWTFASQVGGNEAAVYKDQLTEIDRDVAAGLIGVPEVEATRAEIGRRLLAAVDGGSDPLSQTDSQPTSSLGRFGDGVGGNAARRGRFILVARIAVA